MSMFSFTATLSAAPIVKGVMPLPRWLKRNVPKGNANHFTANLLEELRLETVLTVSHPVGRPLVSFAGFLLIQVFFFILYEVLIMLVFSRHGHVRVVVSNVEFGDAFQCGEVA